MIDFFREAAFRCLPFRWPRPDPVRRSPYGDYRIPQPWIRGLTHLGVAAAERGRGLAFLYEVDRLIWSGSVHDWPAGDQLALAAGRAGLD